MKKTLFAVFLALMTFCLAGCEGGNEAKLSKPQGLRVYQEGQTLVLEWRAVKNADEYALSKNGSYWKMTSVTTATDYDPKEGNNTYEVVAVNDETESEPATITYYYQTSGGGGGEETTTYYIKHPWGSGSDSSWEWKKMTKSGNNYTYTGEWGGVGANINTTADDSGAEWYDKSKISGASSVSVGDLVTFTFSPTSGNNGALSVSSNGGGGGGQTGKLAAPTGFSLTQTTSSIKLSWNRVNGAAGYAVFRALPSDEEYSFLNTTTATSYTDTDVESGETYYYAVAAYDDDDNIGEIAQDYITFKGSGGGSTTTKPNAPTNVSASATSTCIEVSWSSVSGADSYKVYRATSASGTYSYKGNTSSTYYSDCSVTAGTTYYYKVTAENSAGESEKSSYASAKVTSSGGGGTTNYEPCPPSVSCSGTSSVTVKWTASTGSGCGKPTSYNVGRKNPITGKFDFVKEGTTSTSYTDSKPFPGVNTYGVQAKNDYGTSGAQYAISSSIPIKAPEITQVYASYQGLDITVKDLDVPDEWKPYYSLQLYKSTSASGNYYIEAEWKYDQTVAHDYSKKTLTFEKEYGVDMRGQTYYIKCRWVFEGTYSPSRVEGTYSSYKSATHK